MVRANTQKNSDGEDEKLTSATCRKRALKKLHMIAEQEHRKIVDVIELCADDRLAKNNAALASANQ